ncbi:MAG TPA: DNA cytosine methyltransferase [Solirubrobacterales bacterium]
MEAIDLFAGPGGLDLALSTLGVEPLGIEWDDAACATREAAGLRTLQADVAELDPNGFAPCELILASAPCPTYSSAGKGAGRLLTDVVVRCMHELAAGNDTRGERIQEAYEILEPLASLGDVDAWPAPRRVRRRSQAEASPIRMARLARRQKLREKRFREAEMSLLVVEPLRWVFALKPRFVALEQVPEVLGLWSEIAAILGVLGYSTWTGVMEAERYGVPQTRERAILMADREGPVHPPRPTHQRYVKGEPQRHEATMEGEVLPWVSMAEALGWLEGVEPSPAPTVSGGGTGSGGGVEVFAGADSRKRVLEAIQRNGSTGECGERSEDEPAFTVATNADRWKFRNGNRENAAEREASERAPTLHFGARSNKVDWVYDRRQQNSDGSPVPPVPTSEPAPTLTAGGLAKSTHQWVRERPATSVNGDPRISQPGRHDPEESGSQQKDAIRVTEEEALTLQSFPADYPVQGTKSQRFLQIGNAVPPLLAHAILSALLAPVLEAEQKVAA